MERYQTPRLFSEAFQFFCNQFQVFSVCFFFFFFLGLLEHSVSLPSYASQSLQTLWIPCFRDTLYLVRPYFAASQPTCCTYRQMGPGEEFGYPGPCWKERENIAEAAPLVKGLHVCQEKGSSPMFAPPVPNSHHAAVGIIHISQGSYAGKAKTHHNSDETKVWVSLQ